MVKLFDLVDYVAKSTGYECRRSHNNVEKGVYFKTRDGDELFFGIWYSTWQELGWPIVYGVKTATCSPEVIDLFCQRHEGHYKEFANEYKLCRVTEQELKEYNAKIQIAEKITRELAAMERAL